MESFSLIMEARETASRLSNEIMSDTASAVRMIRDYKDSPRGEYYKLLKMRRYHRLKKQVLSAEELKAVENRLGVLEMQIWGHRTKTGLH